MVWNLCCFSCPLAGLLRFYNYDVRWALAHDQARDALVAREALRQHKIPVLGPFLKQGLS